MIIPEQLRTNCRNDVARQSWVERLPSVVENLLRRWSLRIEALFDHHSVTCSWVAAVVRADGTFAVLKLGMPHMEGEDEIRGLRFWDGDPTVRLIEADDELGAMLLERCEPGDMLRSQPEFLQDVIIADQLKRLWRRSASRDGLKVFRHLSALLKAWSEETLAQAQHWPDGDLVREGLQIFEALGSPTSGDVLLATDLHAGNVLRAQREPWLVIDPKPFIGHKTYDVVQHLRNCEARLHADPMGMVKRMADLAEVDVEQLRAWTFARAAADPRADWSNRLWTDIARKLAP